MTSPNRAKRQHQPPRPRQRPNPGEPTLSPGTENEHDICTTDDPLDSPQPKPMIRQDKTKGLRTPKDE